MMHAFTALLTLIQTAVVVAAGDASGGASGGASGVTSGGGTTIVQASGGEPWWHALLQQSFLLIILFIFLTAIITLVIQQRRKDKCLKLMHGYHVNFLRIDGRATWGDLTVFPKGLEVSFDAAYRTLRGIKKTSSLVYETEMDQCLAITRCVSGLTPQERESRKKQIHRSFNPNIFRRMMRSIRNLLNTLRDAFSKALSAIVGQIAKANPANAVLAQQQSGVDQIGQTLLGAAGNAYEAILEHHIGKPVVIQLASPAAPEKRLIDVPGYLVDYTDKYLAVFNVEHEPVSDETLTVAESVDKPGYRIDLSESKAKITCTGPDLLVVKSVKTDQRHSVLEVALTLGSVLEVGRDGSASLEIRLERTRRVDMVCPRSQAIIHFGGAFEEGEEPDRDHGLAPEPEVETHSDDPVAEEK